MRYTTQIPEKLLKQAAEKAGFIKDEYNSIVPSDPNVEGFWEDWEDCCIANNLFPDEPFTPEQDYFKEDL